MSTLELMKLWINLASTGAGLSAPSLGATSSSGLDGEVRSYAGGRQRFVGKEGIGGSLERTLRQLTLVDIALLESWRGQTVLVRDVRGQHWWGTFRSVGRVAVKGSLKFDATITVELVTHDEGV
jgi:hypothetical protein